MSRILLIGAAAVMLMGSQAIAQTGGTMSSPSSNGTMSSGTMSGGTMSGGGMKTDNMKNCTKTSGAMSGGSMSGGAMSGATMGAKPKPCPRPKTDNMSAPNSMGH